MEPAYQEPTSTAHRPSRRSDRRRLALVLGLVTVFMAVEFCAGLFARSLTLIADAGHVLTDALALGLALLAMRFAEMPSTSRKTYGFYRLEILAALGNGVLLAAVSALVVVGAIRRLERPAAVHAPIVIAVAAAGLVVNGIASLVLWRRGGPDRNARHDLNVRGALLHVLGDALGSLGAAAAGIVILVTGSARADAFAAIAVSLVILWGAWRLIRDSLDVLLEGTPVRIQLGEVEDVLKAVDGVRGIHDLHVWCISSGFDALSAHVVVALPGSDQKLLPRLRRAVRDRFGIGHVTVQVEDGSEECHACD